MPFGKFFRRVTNTEKSGGKPPSAGVRPGVSEAKRLLDRFPNADRRDLVETLVAQRQGKPTTFRGIPNSTLRKRK